MYRKNKYMIDSLGSLKGLVKGRKENFKIATVQEGFKCGLSIKNNYAKKILSVGNPIGTAMREGLNGLSIRNNHS